MSLHLYNFFHLNLAYSAIEEEDRPRVIERCYWPLLRLARQRNLPFGIELSGYTLETIAAIDPGWVRELALLINDGPCELVGCGYAQIIGPLVPHEVTAANLRLGHQVYEALLSQRPLLALLNEQAYAAGLVPLYEEAGYRAIIMEWNNPARGHPDWDPEWRYLPQQVQGPSGERLPLVWNKSIAFQKFQRYVHGELELDELLAYVRGHRAEHPRALPLYGNDVEIFDFRPGRYMTEAPLHDDGEWARIDRLYAALQDDPGVNFIRPSEVLELADRPGANQVLRLETAAQPTPVKKQDKYNLLRWAVTGRDDLRINTRCWRLAEALNDAAHATDADWREICYLWSSDFRTHVTDRRWMRYQERLAAFEAKWPAAKMCREAAPSEHGFGTRSPSEVGARSFEAAGGRASTQRVVPHPRERLKVERRGRMLEIQGERLHVRLNCLRGLALDSLVDRAISEQPLCGTLHHGYFDDIRWGADYYSGHLVFETPGTHKVTDLMSVEPNVMQAEGGARVTCVVQTPFGPMEKGWWIDQARGQLVLSYRLHWPEPVLGSLRLGHLTLMPEAFDPASLHYRTHNGGSMLESFELTGCEVDHGRAVSFLVSANQGLGVTGGLVELGDASKRIRMSFKKTQAALIGLVSHHPVQGRHFTRFALSARELDDTSCPVAIGDLAVDCILEMHGK